MFLISDKQRESLILPCEDGASGLESEVYILFVLLLLRT